MHNWVVSYKLSDAELCIAGAAMADVNKPILPGANVTSKDLPNGPKPLEALGGDAGSKVLLLP